MNYLKLTPPIILIVLMEEGQNRYPGMGGGLPENEEGLNTK
jgi:hypothetical protein